jgi:hypothetical protein
MKKIYFNILLMAGLALAACSSDDEEKQGQVEHQEPKTYYMTVDATKGADEGANNASTRALVFDDGKLNATWATTEQVYVQATNPGSSTFWFNGSIKPQTAGTSTFLNGTITLPGAYSSIEEATGEAHPTLTLQFPRKELDYEGQVGTLADIAENYDYATATINVDIINDRIVPYTETPAEFESQQAIVKFTLIDVADGTTLLNPTILNVQYGTESVSLTSIPASTYTTNGNGVLYVAIPGFSGQKVTLSALVGSTTYTFITSGITFENGKYYEIDVKMKKRVS